MHAATRIPVTHSGMITLILYHWSHTVNRGRISRVDKSGLFTRMETRSHDRARARLHVGRFQFSVRFCNSRIPPGGYLITYAPRSVITFARSGYRTSKRLVLRMTADAAISTRACQRAAPIIFLCRKCRRIYTFCR